MENWLRPDLDSGLYQGPDLRHWPHPCLRPRGERRGVARPRSQTLDSIKYETEVNQPAGRESELAEQIVSYFEHGVGLWCGS